MKKLRKYQVGSEVKLQPQMPILNANMNVSNLGARGIARMWDPVTGAPMTTLHTEGILNPQQYQQGQPIPQTQQPAQQSQATMQNKWQFGLNMGHIAKSQFAQSILAYLRNKKIEKDDVAYQQAQSNPLLQIPFTPNTTDASQFGEQLMKKGGPSPSKAAEMLKDGKANGKKLTAKQKKYFQCVKHGGCKKQDGGTVEEEIEREIEAEMFADQQPVATPPVVQEEKKAEIEEEVVDMTDPLEELNELLEEDQTYPFKESTENKELPAGTPPISTRGPLTPIQEFKAKIAGTEQAGYFSPTSIKNDKGEPISSAFGKYQFLKGTRRKVRDMFYKDIPVEEFEDKYKTSPQFQEEVMDRYSAHLLSKFKDPKIAAKAFFMGEASKNLYSDDPSYKPTPENKSVGKYLKDAGFQKGGYLQGVGEGFTGFFSGVKNKVKQAVADPIGTIQGAPAAIVQGALQSSPLGMLNTAFDSAKQVYGNFMAGNPQAAGQFTGNKLGQGVLDLGLTAITGPGKVVTKTATTAARKSVPAAIDRNIVQKVKQTEFGNSDAVMINPKASYLVTPELLDMRLRTSVSGASAFDRYRRSTPEMLSSYGPFKADPTAILPSNQKGGQVPNKGSANFKRRNDDGKSIQQDADIEGPIGFLNSYYNSPAFEKRLQNSSTPKQVKGVKNYLAQQQATYLPWTDPEGHGSHAHDSFEEALAEYDEKKPTDPNFRMHTVYLAEKDEKYGSGDKSMNLLNTVLPHEYAHWTRNLNTKEQMAFMKANKLRTHSGQSAVDVYNEYQKNKNRVYEDEDGNKFKMDFTTFFYRSDFERGHDLHPEESYADLQALRWALYDTKVYDTRKGELNQKDLDKFRQRILNTKYKDDLSIGRLLENFSDEDIIKLNNTIGYQDTEDALPTAKKGGIHIKKENRGKFTEYCGGKVTAECIKRGKNSSNPTTRKRATFAANARKWQFGGELAFNPNLAQADQAFQKWYSKSTLEGQNKIPYSEALDYDYYSFFRNKAQGNIKDHFPDTFKRPTHPTFSNESIYSTPENPGGTWKGETFIPHKYKEGGYYYMDDKEIKKLKRQGYKIE